MTILTALTAVKMKTILFEFLLSIIKNLVHK
mgnify:CR=1 FL=1|jgi:hypothetical protein